MENAIHVLTYKHYLIKKYLVTPEKADLIVSLVKSIAHDDASSRIVNDIVMYTSHQTFFGSSSYVGVETIPDYTLVNTSTTYFDYVSKVLPKVLTSQALVLAHIRDYAYKGLLLVDYNNQMFALMNSKGGFVSKYQPVTTALTTMTEDVVKKNNTPIEVIDQSKFVNPIKAIGGKQLQDINRVVVDDGLVQGIPMKNLKESIDKLTWIPTTPLEVQNAQACLMTKDTKIPFVFENDDKKRVGINIDSKLDKLRFNTHRIADNTMMHDKYLEKLKYHDFKEYDESYEKRAFIERLEIYVEYKKTNTDKEDYPKHLFPFSPSWLVGLNFPDETIREYLSYHVFYYVGRAKKRPQWLCVRQDDIFMTGSTIITYFYLVVKFLKISVLASVASKKIKDFNGLIAKLCSFYGLPKLTVPLVETLKAFDGPLEIEVQGVLSKKVVDMMAVLSQFSSTESTPIDLSGFEDINEEVPVLDPRVLQAKKDKIKQDLEDKSIRSQLKKEILPNQTKSDLSTPQIVTSPIPPLLPPPQSSQLPPPISMNSSQSVTNGPPQYQPQVQNDNRYYNYGQPPPYYPPNTGQHDVNSNQQRTEWRRMPSSESQVQNNGPDIKVSPNVPPNVQSNSLQQPPSTTPPQQISVTGSKPPDSDFNSLSAFQ